MTIDLLPNEVFKPIPNYTDYLLSNMGRCYSTKSNQVLKPNLNNKDYVRYDLKVRNKPFRKHIFAHINVVRLFGDSKGKLLTKEVLETERLSFFNLNIDHIDGDKLNNRQSNLEIVSHAENMRRLYERQRREFEEDTDKLPF